MTYAQQDHIANTFYSGRTTEPVPVHAKLPAAPKNASPVPYLTSLYHDDKADNYGDRSYPGNCGGNLIRDLLLYFRPRSVSDPIFDSGTCRDVCTELGIDCWSSDIHQGLDFCEPANFYGDSAKFQRSSFDFVWIHPPYWRQKLYAADERDLSRTATLDEFLERYQQAIFSFRRLPVLPASDVVCPSTASERSNPNERRFPGNLKRLSNGLKISRSIPEE